MNPRKVIVARGLFDLKATSAVGRRARDAKLSVIARLHHLLVAISIESVERLVLPSAVSVLRGCAANAPGVVDVEGRSHASWDIGQLLGLGPAMQAWILLTIERGDARVPVAFGTGACLAIEETPASVRLSSGTLRARAVGIQGAFLPPASVAARGGEYGLVLDPTRILSPSELDASAVLVGGRAGS